MGLNTCWIRVTVEVLWECVMSAPILYWSMCHSLPETFLCDSICYRCSHSDVFYVTIIWANSFSYWSKIWIKKCAGTVNCESYMTGYISLISYFNDQQLSTQSNREFEGIRKNAVGMFCSGRITTYSKLSSPMITCIYHRYKSHDNCVICDSGGISSIFYRHIPI